MKPKTPLISIITVCKNACAPLEKTILSLRMQSFKDFEFIIVDGKSSDGTLEVIKKNADIVSKYISETDSGIYDAMNKGIEMSLGSYLYFLNAGDVFYEEGTLAVVSDFLAIDSLSVVFGDVLIEGNNTGEGRVLKYIDNDFVSLLRRPINHQVVFAARSVFKRNGLFDIDFKIRGDHDWELRNYKDKAIRFIHVPFVIARYQETGFTTNNKARYGIRERKLLIKKNISFAAITLYRLLSPIGLIDRLKPIRNLMNFVLLNT